MPLVRNITRKIIPEFLKSQAWVDFFTGLLGTDSQTDMLGLGNFNRLLQRRGAPLTLPLDQRYISRGWVPVNEVDGTIYALTLDIGNVYVQTSGCTISNTYPTTSWNTRLQLRRPTYEVHYAPVYVKVPLGITLPECSLSITENFLGIDSQSYQSFFYQWDLEQPNGELSAPYHLTRTSPYYVREEVARHSIDATILYEYEQPDGTLNNGSTNVLRRESVYIEVLDEPTGKIFYADTILKLSSRDYIVDGIYYNPIIGYDKGYITLDTEPSHRYVITNDFDATSEPSLEDKNLAQIQAYRPELPTTEENYKDVVLNIGSMIGWNDVYRTRYWVPLSDGELLSRLALMSSTQGAQNYLQRLIDAVTPARAISAYPVTLYSLTDTVIVTDSPLVYGRPAIAASTGDDPNGMVIQGEPPMQPIFIVRPSQ